MAFSDIEVLPWLRPTASNRPPESAARRGYVGAELFGRAAQFIHWCRPAVDDGDDVLEVMTDKKISSSAVLGRFKPAGSQPPGRMGDLPCSLSLDQAGHYFKRVAARGMVVHVAGQH